MKKTGFMLDHWKVFAIIGLALMIADIIRLIRNKRKNGESIKSEELLDTIAGR
ncbi:hypothetical protein KKB99_00695 [bacterium]|nr:hypothetical protein [bacterium]MBU1024503.1 hypothetical protein [bacterium]